MAERTSDTARKRPRPSLPTAVLVAVVCALALWRATYVLAGPDPDTDAYGHHVIARQILATPTDLRVHWVWLPLFHYAQALAILLGATMQSVRFFNVAVSAAVPLVVYATLRATRAMRIDGATQPPRVDAAVPWIAAMLTALSPIAMQMGTTGQTEPLFALLTATIAWSFLTERPRLCATLVSIAVLIRYEAWALPPAIGSALALEAAMSPRGSAARARLLSPRWLSIVVAPLAFIVAWAALRRPQDGGWFLFLGHTRQFATGALGAVSSFHRGIGAVVADLGYYTVEVPWRCFGYPLLLVPFGFVAALRREGLRFFAVYSAVLAFVTLVWIERASLGLDRHFVAIVPLYATMAAHGIVTIAAFIERHVARGTSPRDNSYLAAGASAAAIVAGVSTAAIALDVQLLDRWMGDWRNASERAWGDRRAVAAFLREHADGTIFCDEPTIEVLTGLPRDRFDRHGVNDADGLARLNAAIARQGHVYVATWSDHAKDVEAIGETVLRPPTWTQTEDGLIVVRVGR